MPDRIPLFPLELVLFPGAALPLHIFEPRYKLMVGRCLEQKQPFGIVLARGEGIAAVGCTAQIVLVISAYPDGRLDILTAGVRRFRIGELFDDLPYLQADVNFLDDEPRQPLRDFPSLLNLYEQCHRLIHGRPPDPPDNNSKISPAYQIAIALPLELEFKQDLLETRSEQERQATLIERFREWLPQLEHRDRVRRKASGNGHAH